MVLSPHKKREHVVYSMKRTNLNRPDSRKPSNSPTGSMMRRLARDRNCHPVIRGILETLLHYLTQDLPKSTDRHLGKPDIDWSGQRIKFSMKQSQLQTSCANAPPLEESKTTQEKTVEASSEIPEKCWSNPQREKLQRKCGDQKAGDSKPRRLTTFQLLQAKFVRSTPKPPITHQRDVGMLSSRRREAGEIKHQDSELKIHKREWIRKQHGLRRGSSVKDIVAKFAMAEQKEEGKKTPKPMKPRLIRRGILLSSLMERFEAVANVSKGRDLKCSHQTPSEGVKATSDVKQGVTFREGRDQQVVDQTVHGHNQHKQMIRKPLGQHLKRNRARGEEELLPAQALDVFTDVDSNLEEKNDLKSEQMMQRGDEHLDQKAESQCSLKHIKAQADDKDVKGCGLDEQGGRQTTAEDTGVTKKLKYGQREQLCLTSASEPLLPEPHRLHPKVEAKVFWRVATITPCSPAWSTCVDSSPKRYAVEPSECSHANLRAEILHTALWCCHRKSNTGETARTAADGRYLLMPKTEGRNSIESRAPEDLSSAKDVTIPRELPKYVVPRAHRFDYQQGIEDLAESSSPSASHAETSTPLVATPPTHPDTPLSAFGPGEARRHPNNMTVQALHTTTNGETTGANPQENVGETKEKSTSADACMSQGVGLSGDAADEVAAFEESETSPKIKLQSKNPKHRPKYTTINYGDVSLKQTYKPKIIRFTDTFTF